MPCDAKTSVVRAAVQNTGQPGFRFQLSCRQHQSSWPGCQQQHVLLVEQRGFREGGTASTVLFFVNTQRRTRGLLKPPFQGFHWNLEIRDCPPNQQKTCRENKTLPPQWEPTVLVAAVAQPCSPPGKGRCQLAEWHGGQQQRWPPPPRPPIPCGATPPISAEGRGRVKGSQQSRWRGRAHLGNVYTICSLCHDQPTTTGKSNHNLSRPLCITPSRAFKKGWQRWERIKRQLSILTTNTFATEPRAYLASLLWAFESVYMPLNTSCIFLSVFSVVGYIKKGLYWRYLLHLGK